MRALELVKKLDREPGVEWFEADPDVLYPAALHYLEQLVKGAMPTPAYLAQYVDEAKTLPPDIFQSAKTASLEDFPEGEGRDNYVLALELARLVFTEMLHQAVALAPMGLKIKVGPEEQDKRARWRIRPSREGVGAPGMRGNLLRNA